VSGKTNVRASGKTNVRTRTNAMTRSVTHTADILNGLLRMREKIVNPDKQSNVGKYLGEAFFWDTIESLAKKRSEQAWSAMESDGIWTPDEAAPGDYVLNGSPSFELRQKISEPVRRFSSEELAVLMRDSKYKVPVPITLELVNKAKVPGKSSRRVWVVERGVEAK
jgi:hypothetical protein